MTSRFDAAAREYAKTKIQERRTASRTCEFDILNTDEADDFKAGAEHGYIEGHKASGQKLDELLRIERENERKRIVNLIRSEAERILSAKTIYGTEVHPSKVAEWLEEEAERHG